MAEADGLTVFQNVDGQNGLSFSRSFTYVLETRFYLFRGHYKGCPLATT